MLLLLSLSLSLGSSWLTALSNYLQNARVNPPIKRGSYLLKLFFCPHRLLFDFHPSFFFFWHYLSYSLFSFDRRRRCRRCLTVSSFKVDRLPVPRLPLCSPSRPFVLLNGCPAGHQLDRSSARATCWTINEKEWRRIEKLYWSYGRQKEEANWREIKLSTRRLRVDLYVLDGSAGCHGWMVQRLNGWKKKKKERFTAREIQTGIE